MRPLIELVWEFQRARTREQDDRLGEQLFQSIVPLVRSVIARMCPAHAQEEVFAEATASILRGLDKFRGKTDQQFWAWVIKITRYKCIDSYRKKDQSIVMDPAELERMIDASARVEPIVEPERARLRELLRALIPDGPCFQLLWWRHIEEWTVREIAVELGIAPAAVRMRIRRCVQMIEARRAGRGEP